MSESKHLKINLLTFHRALSYGAVLQTYAMTKVLESMGHQVEIIDFQKPFLPTMPTGWWSFMKNFGIERLKKEYTFYSFRKKYFNSCTKTLKTVEDVQNYKFNADVYLVGSDQVWNPRITKESLGIYFFNFVKGKKVSYAASFGTDQWTSSKEESEKVKTNLAEFSAISVREESGLKIITDVFGLDATTVLDPTLIWSDYSALIKPVKYEDYIFVFKVNHSDEFIEKGIEIGEALNKQIIFVGDKHYHPNVISLPNPSVEEWISLLYHSSFVFTDSFHGMAFSLNFKKDFLMFNTNPNRFTRIESLLKKIELRNRVHGNVGNIKLDLSPINYYDFDSKLNIIKSDSISFLKKALFQS